MAESADLARPARIVLTLPYRLSPGGVEHYVATTGMEPPLKFRVELDLTKLPLDLRARAAALRSQLPPPSLEDLSLAPLSGIPYLDEATNEPAVLIGAWEAHLEKKRKEREAAAAAQRQREAKAAEESRMFKAQMSTWITDHGSDALRTANLRGYNVVSSYLRERVAIDFPGFVIDAQRKAKWEERANPSKAALSFETDALDRANRCVPRPTVRVVWLTRAIDGTDYKPFIRFAGNGPQPREAVIVAGYLGRYVLVRDVAPDEVR